MCFSASASFGASVLLTIIGTATLKKAKQPNQVPFATIPLLFAIQQVSEGFVWLALSNPAFESYEFGATNFFLFFAQIVWPVWVPLSVLLLIPPDQRKWFQKVFVGIGAVVSLYLAYCLVNFPVTASILGYHIAYEQGYPRSPALYIGALYLLATITPLLLTRISRMWILGFMILISYIITAVFYSDYIVSVWCFFAAVISIVVLAIVLKFSPHVQEKVNAVLPID